MAPPGAPPRSRFGSLLGSLSSPAVPGAVTRVRPFRRAAAAAVALAVATALLVVPAPSQSPLGPDPAAAQSSTPTVPAGCGADPASPTAWIDSVTATATVITTTLADPLPVTPAGGESLALCGPSPTTANAYQRYHLSALTPVAGLVVTTVTDITDRQGLVVEPDTDYWIRVNSGYGNSNNAWFHVRTAAARTTADAHELVTNRHVGPNAMNTGDDGSFIAVSFTTGSDMDGFTLTEAVVNYKANAANASTSVKIRNDSGGAPGTTVVATLTGTLDTAAGAKTFTAPSGTRLTAGTKYWLMINEGVSGTRAAVQHSQADDEGARLFGWSIGNSRLYRSSESSSWTNAPSTGLGTRVPIFGLRGFRGSPALVKASPMGCGAGMSDGNAREFADGIESATPSETSVAFKNTSPGTNNWPVSAPAAEISLWVCKPGADSTYSASEALSAGTYNLSGGATNTVSGLTADTDYWFQFRGYGARTDWYYVRTLPEGLKVPEGLTVTGRTPVSLAVSWTASAAATDYDVRYFAGSADPATEADWIEDGEAGAAPDPGAETMVEIQGLEPGTAYRVQVRAGDGTNESAWSASGSASTPALLAGAVTLVSNVGQTDHGSVFSDLGSFDRSQGDFAQGFSTGSNADGYVLAEVVVDAESGTGGTMKPVVGMAVAVRKGSGPAPSQSTLVASLAGPHTIANGGEVRFHAPPGTVLDASSQYWVVVSGASGRLLTKTSGSEDSGGAAGWSLEDFRRNSNASGTFDSDSHNPLGIAVKGAERDSTGPVPVSVSAAARSTTVTVTFDEALKSDFGTAGRPGDSLDAVVDGVDVAVSAAAVKSGDATMLELTLASPVRAGAWVVVDYAAPPAATNPSSAELLQDEFGNQAEDFLARGVAGAAALVSNISTAASSTTGAAIDVKRAQLFTTGSNSEDYVLGSVELDFVTAPAGVTVKLTQRVVAGQTSDGTAVATLTAPSTLAAGVLKFTPSSRVVLDASTEYSVVVQGTSGQIRSTTNTSDDSGAAAGWSVDDTACTPSGGNNSNAWNCSSSTAFSIRVNGAVVDRTPPAPTAAAVSGDAWSVTFDDDVVVGGDDFGALAALFTPTVDGTAGSFTGANLKSGDDTTIELTGGPAAGPDSAVSLRFANGALGAAGALSDAAGNTVAGFDTAGAMVSNLGQPRNTQRLDTLAPGVSYAQAFSVGSASLALASVTVQLAGPSPAGIVVKLLEGSDVNSASEAATLTNPATLRSGTPPSDNLFTAPANTVLKSNTTYFVQVQGTASDVVATSSLSVDSGAAPGLSLSGGMCTKVGTANSVCESGVRFRMSVNSVQGPPLRNTTPPGVSSVAISSDPGLGDLYALDEDIEVSLTFNTAVTVDTTNGTPSLKIDLSSGDGTTGEKTATYQRGSGSRTLVFRYKPVAGDASTDGVAVVENSLALNSGTIKSSTDTDAVLTHSMLAHDTEHLVDTAAPTLSRQVVTESEVILVYNEPLDGGSTPNKNQYVYKENNSVRGLASVAVSPADGGASWVVVDLSAAGPDSETPTLTYRYSATSGDVPLRDLAGNPAAGISTAVTLAKQPTPSFDDGASKSLMIEENHDSEASVGTVAATGAVEAVAGDGNADTLAYSLTSTSGDHNSFTISSSGEIKVKSGVTLNHEAKSSYSFTAQVTDGEDQSGGAQSSGVAVSNSGRANSGQEGVRAGIAQGFTTGDVASRLVSVELNYRVSVSPHSLAVHSALPPSAQNRVAAMIRPASFAGPAAYTWTAPAGTLLQRNTEYFLVASGGSSFGQALAVTDSFAEDSGSAAGWSIDDGLFLGRTNNYGTKNTGKVLRFSVTAESTTVDDTIGVTVAVTDVDEPPTSTAVPTGVSVTAQTSRSLTVGWTAPTGTGTGPAIDDYDVRWFKCLDAMCTDPSDDSGWTIRDASAWEHAGPLSFAVERDHTSAAAVTLSYRIAGSGTATGGERCDDGVDFIEPPGSATLEAAQTAVTISVELCDDGDAEDRETLAIELLGVPGRKLAAAGTIVSDD